MGKAEASDYRVYGIGGVELSEKWAGGPRTYYALNTHGFPNMFIMNGPQGPILANNNIQQMDMFARHMVHVLARMRREGLSYLDPREEAEAEYCKMIFDASSRAQKFFQNCTPGFINNEGDF